MIPPHSELRKKKIIRMDDVGTPLI